MGADSPALTERLSLRRQWPVPTLTAACWFVAGLALSRLLYEALFPAWGWMGRPIPALGLGAVVAVLGVVLARRLGARAGETPALRAIAFLPLLLNLVWLVDPAVELARGRFLFGASWWLVAILLVWLALGDADRRWLWLGPVFVAVALLPVYLATMSHAVGAADTFEFQVVAPQLGIAHPTGYPLYLILGKLFSLLPVGTTAWRLNFASAVYAVLAAIVVFRLALELVGRPLSALLGAVALGLVPAFWSQAIIAEVYTLHALIVAAALWLMIRLTAGGRPTTGDERPTTGDRKTMVALAFVLGLGLTNHLTTVFLLPPAAIAIMTNLWPTIVRRSSTVSRRRSLALLLLQLSLAFALPLLLYLYLPTRWAAINGEPMGLDRFVDWVIGGRFQGALQWGAWRRDPTRWPIIGRLLRDAWGWFYLGLAAIGLIWLFARQWRAALVLLVAAIGFTFYALNYYVPDLAVFLIPTHVVIAVWIAAGVVALYEPLETEFFRANSRSPNSVSRVSSALIFVLAISPAVLAVGGRATGVASWLALDQSGRDGGEPWARGVLALPLARGAAILADSEKIAPLYYLQQIEGLRPDLDIMVLPDEAAYRAELDARLAAGQAVYLARYLPGLAGAYHLRSMGPLVEVSREPPTELPAHVAAAGQSFGPLRLLGYQLETPVAGAPAITLYWTLAEPLASGEETPTLHTRWSSVRYGVEAMIASGQHPVANNYPINALRPGEIVPDYHTLPAPIFACDQPGGCDLDLQVAIAPRFTANNSLEWATVARIPVTPPPGPITSHMFRARLGGFLLDGAEFPAQVRPGAPLTVRYSGFGQGSEPAFSLREPGQPAEPLLSLGVISLLPPGESAQYEAEVETYLPNGLYELAARPSLGMALCGWLARPSADCILGEVEISGAALPEGAVNFDDQIALLEVEMEADNLAPGGQLPVTITWQGLSEMSEDYTVFVQVLDAADRIVGQVDAWPVQGTFPTSQWRPGEVVRDPYVVQLSDDLPPGDYRVIIGLYLLATGQRLPVVNEAGNAIDDKVVTRIIVE
jgi:hypothetical protein